jgi:EpsI family protein
VTTGLNSGVVRNPWTWFVAVVFAGVIALYVPVFVTLVQQWYTNDTNSHGFLVVLLSGYFVWQRRDQLRQISPKPDFVLGTLTTALGLGLLLGGDLAAVSTLRQTSFLVTLIGVVLLVGGRDVLRGLAFPIAFLVFMIPIWEMALEPLAAPLQLVSARGGTALLRLLDVPVYQVGVQVHLPHIILEVAKECSGVNYLISVIALSSALGYLGLSTMTSRVILVVSSALISIAGNIFRVALIGVLQHNGFAGEVHGPGHMLQGLFAAAVGYLGVAVVYALLRKHHQRPADAIKEPRTVSLSWDPRILAKGCAVVAVLSGGAAVVQASHSVSPVPLREPLASIPPQVAGWEATTGSVTLIPHRPPLADIEGAWRYSNPGMASNLLYIGYFERQTQGKELVNYATKELSGKGRRVTLDLGPQGTMAVEEFVEVRNGRSQIVTYWYDVNGRIETDRYRLKLQTMIDAILRGATNGALLMVITEIRPGEPEEQARASRDSFLRAGWVPLRRSLFSAS